MVVALVLLPQPVLPTVHLPNHSSPEVAKDRAPARTLDALVQFLGCHNTPGWPCTSCPGDPLSGTDPAVRLSRQASLPAQGADPMVVEVAKQELKLQIACAENLYTTDLAKLNESLHLIEQRDSPPSQLAAESVI